MRVVRSGALPNVLLATAETYSRYLHPDDRSTVPFGDGGAATLICRAGDDQEGIGRFVLGTGRQRRAVHDPGGRRARLPAHLKSGRPATLANHVRMDGLRVLAFVRANELPDRASAAG
jgi:3-oxoacyl-[acyl-carrier-protein] synthase III